MLSKYVLPIALAVGACSSEARPQPAPSTLPSTAPAKAQSVPPVATLTRIDAPSTVCMVNDQHMGVPQIPVHVAGKTYYGCCEMCEAKLKGNEQARLGTDPVSQKVVDKASAVLARDPEGKVLYFESEATMRTYAQRM